ncbi:DUF3923 family protein [Enterococcus durans]|uniref:DUF3923 family protein n=1 Tax=Enterococcus durans TaxID=53345 RepID=UPI001883D94C|nr:DUF3923 family protein [Enterococcus durans]MBE9887162.1 DUF3923 family protein [Enterococcus durans]
MKLWKVVNILELVIFVVGILFLWFRKVDGSGVVNTTNNKMVSIAMLVVFFIILAIIQLVWFKAIKRSR